MRFRSPAKMIAALPIRQKIGGIVMFTTFCALLLVSGAFILYDFHSVRRSTALDLDTLTGVVASNSAAALMFGDIPTCHDILAGLGQLPSITSAAIYASNGKPFVTYGAFRGPFLLRNNTAVIIDDEHIHAFRKIVFRGDIIGTLYVASDLRDMQGRMHMQVIMACGILAIALLIAFAMTSRLQTLVTGPLLVLAGTAMRVSREKDYSVRVPERDRLDHDEIGAVMHAFNEMLEQIENRDAALGRNRTDLEREVVVRTMELSEANGELLIAKTAAERVAEVNAQLARESALILNSATDGIIGVGLDTEPSFLNPAGARMLGRSLADLHGQSIHTLIHHSRADGTPLSEADCPLGQAILSGEALTVTDDTFWRADRSSFPVEYSVTSMLDDSGNKLGAVVLFRDITERRAIEKLKGEFVSTVSHELRTPLTSIRGALGLLSSGLLGTIAVKAQRMLEIAVSNTDRLVRLINDILDLERIDSGKVELMRRGVDAHAVMVQALDGVRTIADEAGVSLVIVPATGTLWGDSDRIIQTLTNLLGNAIKFSPRDTTVTLSGDAGKSEFVFCVADQGRGVPVENLETIFGRFSQVDASDSRDKGGSGLGLAICRSIVTAHGGRIWVVKNDPAGSRFLFTIPMKVVSGVTLPDVQSSAALELDAAASVLVVEDDIDLARVMTTALRNHGIKVFHAVNGTDALQLCKEHELSLIVLDLILPDMDGFAIVAALRESATLRGIPLLVYSAIDVGLADQARLRLGPTEFMTKSRSSLADFERQVIRLLVASGKLQGLAA